MLTSRLMRRHVHVHDKDKAIYTQSSRLFSTNRPGWIQTYSTLRSRQVLYQLSYQGSSGRGMYKVQSCICQLTLAQCMGVKALPDESSSHFSWEGGREGGGREWGGREGGGREGGGK